MQIYDSIRSSFMDLICIIVCCGLGSVIKDMYNTITNKDARVNVLRILISTVVSCFIVYCCEDVLLQYVPIKVFMLICFIAGLVGFELTHKLTNLESVLKIFSKISFKK